MQKQETFEIWYGLKNKDIVRNTVCFDYNNLGTIVEWYLYDSLQEDWVKQPIDSLGISIRKSVESNIKEFLFQPKDRDADEWHDDAELRPSYKGA